MFAVYVNLRDGRNFQMSIEVEQPKYGHKVPAKVLRHFPLIPRLQRLLSQ